MVSKKKQPENNDLAVESVALNNQSELSKLDNKNIGSVEAREDVYENILQKLEQRGVDISNTSISFDSQVALQYSNNNVTNKLTDSQAALLKSALDDPHNFKGKVEIKVGNRVLLKIQDGQVLRDTQGLTGKKINIEVSSSSKDLYEKHSSGVKETGLAKTKQVAVNALSDGLSTQQAKEIIRKEDNAYAQLKEQIGEQKADRQLESLVSQVVRQQQIPQIQDKTQQNQQTQETAPTR